jgi:hypothetical protein
MDVRKVIAGRRLRKRLGTDRVVTADLVSRIRAARGLPVRVHRASPELRAERAAKVVERSRRD